MTAWPAAVAALLVLLAGCSDGGSEPDRGAAPPGYAAVPDDELAQAVEALPAVRSAEVEHVDRLGQANTYRATVEVGRVSRTEARETFDQVVELLRHGRWQAATSVEVVTPQRVVTGAGLGLVSSADYEERYGPQTGQEGWPPPFADAR